MASRLRAGGLCSWHFVSLLIVSTSFGYAGQLADAIADEAEDSVLGLMETD